MFVFGSEFRAREEYHKLQVYYESMEHGVDGKRLFSMGPADLQVNIP